MKKKIIYLLLAVSFVACKKDDSPLDDKKTIIKEIWEKELWKTEGYNVKYYDAEGKILHSEDNKSYAFTAIFDSKGKNGIFIHDNLNTDPKTFRYTYENNYITIDYLTGDYYAKKPDKFKIEEVTDNSMVWKEEHGADNFIKNVDGKLESIKAAKTVITTNFSKVKRSNETSIKGIWKAENYDRNYYDAEGKLMYSDSYKGPFAVYIDDKYITNVSRVIYYNQEFGYPDTHTYVHINNIITRTSGSSGGVDFGDERQITELTATSMTWREEFVNNWKDKNVNKKTYETKPGEPNAKPAKAVFTIKLAKVNDL